MQKAEITLTLVRTPKGNIRISKDGCSVLVVDSMENIALLSFLSVELDYKLKSQTNEENPSIISK